MVDWYYHGPKLRAALEALMTHPHISMSDLAYQVREQEGQGWNGPGVLSWADAVNEAEKVLKDTAS